MDEIHRLSSAVEEVLYPALEDFRLDIIVGQGPAARTLTLDVPPFTLVGATTRTGLLTTPLRDRFGMTFRLDYYEPDELALIVRSAGILGVEIGDDAAEEIARRSRGTPRVANRILRRVRDVAEVRHQGVITPEIAREALELLEVDGCGSSAPIARSSARSWSDSTAARSVSRRSRSPWARSRTPSRTSTSRTSSSSASSSARPVDESSRSRDGSTSARRSTRRASSSPAARSRVPPNRQALS